MKFNAKQIERAKSVIEIDIDKTVETLSTSSLLDIVNDCTNLVEAYLRRFEYDHDLLAWICELSTNRNMARRRIYTAKGAACVAGIPPFILGQLGLGMSVRKSLVPSHWIDTLFFHRHGTFAFSSIQSYPPQDTNRDTLWPNRIASYAASSPGGIASWHADAVVSYAGC